MYDNSLLTSEGSKNAYKKIGAQNVGSPGYGQTSNSEQRFNDQDSLFEKSCAMAIRVLAISIPVEDCLCLLYFLILSSTAIIDTAFNYYFIYGGMAGEIVVSVFLLLLAKSGRASSIKLYLSMAFYILFILGYIAWFTYGLLKISDYQKLLPAPVIHKLNMLVGQVFGFFVVPRVIVLIVMTIITCCKKRSQNTDQY